MTRQELRRLAGEKYTAEMDTIEALPDGLPYDRVTSVGTFCKSLNTLEEFVEISATAESEGWEMGSYYIYNAHLAISFNKNGRGITFYVKDAERTLGFLSNDTCVIQEETRVIKEEAIRCRR